jgi:DNA polymerase-3 subunit gamma/tau
MSHASLTTRYRPQTFAELAGQGTLKAILARAAAEGKVAPAYLFSGTRGVGKTTIARIFAKALNCPRPVETPLGQEPCNHCELCRAITQGSCVDVLEIDGASNRGIDNVRELKESVGYAPMEARYKIFIIDEAHMLSREAFNALLKTLEEPPARVTFIMATTEPHKFPLTIISRCQHYVFKRLGDAELEAHLRKILDVESVPYENKALQLLVRRAAGSARDAMSLLGQVLALGGAELSESDVRAVLGLAGQEFFFELLAAIRNADCAALSGKVRAMLNQGVDVGFFLRELAQMWRNLFMLSQVGPGAGSLSGLMELSEAEAGRWRHEAQGMSLTHIHACWQLTLEGQRRVLTSLEPAMALELLLFNLALFPRLVSLEQLSNFERKQAGGAAVSVGQPARAEKKSPPDEVTRQPEAALEPVTPPPASPSSLKSAPPEPDLTPEISLNEAPSAAEDEYFSSAAQASPLQTTPGQASAPAPEPQRQADYAKIGEEIDNLPVVRALKEKLGAEILDYGPWYK